MVMGEGVAKIRVFSLKGHACYILVDFTTTTPRGFNVNVLMSSQNDWSLPLKGRDVILYQRMNMQVTQT